MNNNDLARNFGNGATKGKGSNIFIEGDTIYSYGYHFPIAKRFKDIYLFNGRGYSNTTACHKSHVKEYLTSTVIELINCDLNKIDAQIEQNNEEIKNLQDKLTRARSENVKYSRRARIVYLNEQNELLRRLK